MNTVKFDAIPADLKAINNWVVWKAVKAKDKTKKVPYNPATHRPASVTNKDAWQTFETAKAALKEKPYAGMGFVFDGGIVGIDFDNKGGDEIKCIEDLPQEVREILAKAKTYTELSPSKTGLHMLMRGKLEKGQSHRARLQCGWEVEIYETGRYFTVTGSTLNNHEINNNADDAALIANLINTQAINERNNRKDERIVIDKKNNALINEKNSVIECDSLELMRRAKHDEKLKALWSGDYSDYLTKNGQPDHSQADFALCLKLCFYTNGDTFNIHNLFILSGLMRAKWLEKHGVGTYGDITIAKAQQAWNGRGWKEYGTKEKQINSTVGGGSEPTPTPAPAAPEKTKQPNGYKLTERGLVYEPAGDPESRVWISGQIKISARTRNMATGTGWGKLIEFADPDGKAQAWSMPMRELAGNAYIRNLYDMGLDINTTDAARALLTRYIQEIKPTITLDCIDKTGWYNGAFVLPDECIRPINQQAAILETPLQHNPYNTAGSLEDWQTNVSALAAGNSRLVFALSTAFAAPLLGLLGGEENGGFHFRGMSSEGKTVILRAASSVFGNPADYMQRWRATAVGIEQVAVAYNDTLLCLDELGQVDPHTAGEVAYMLANGQGKLRGARTGGLRKTDKWRMLFLSTGEISLAQHMTDGKRQARAGQELRLADIPSNAGAGLGAFETLHETKSGADFAESLTRNTGMYYGAAGRAYLALLVNNPDKAAEIVTNIRAEFDGLIPHTAAGQAVRVARRFILVGAAGELATQLGITGWRKDEAMDAAYKCMTDWIAARGGDGQKEISTALEQVQAWFQVHAPSRCSVWHEMPTLDQTINRAGFRKSTNNEGHEHYILPAVFKTEICTGMDWRQVADWLIDRGWLIPTKDADGKITAPTRAERLPGLGNTRVFRFAHGIEGREI